jgi:hypothetical protein
MYIISWSGIYKGKKDLNNVSKMSKLNKSEEKFDQATSNCELYKKNYICLKCGEKVKKYG